MSQEYGGGTDDLIINAQGIRVTTRGETSYGLWARNQGSGGETRMDIRDSTIATHGNQAHGIYGYRANSSGDVDIDVTGGSTTTGGALAFGLYVRHQKISRDSTGNIEITTRNHAVETTGTAPYPNLDGTYSYGIYADNENTGNIVIDLSLIHI